MRTKLRVYTNEDDALLFWSIADPIDACRGFAIERRKRNGNGNAKATECFLANRVGFEHDDLPSDPGEDQDPEPLTKPSTEWPFQRFSWTDHDANTGDTVSYRVIPVIRNDAGELERVNSMASEWSPERTLGEQKSSTFRPFFNRGFVMSQFMARFLKEKKLSLKQFKETIRDKDDETIRLFLSGDLRVELLNQLEIARKEKTDVHAALFELSDDELVDALCALGRKAHVVLANGSVTKRKDETATEARKRDENEKARKRLTKAKVEVEVDNRFISPGALGHNKFLVRMGKNGKPAVVWTGSTNWAPTGLCTQVNNGLLIGDPGIAQVYLDQWTRLRTAGSAFPKDLIDENSRPKTVPGANDVRSIVWFTRARKGVDLDALRDEVQHARDGILFLMFMPGSTGLFSTVAARSAEPNLYVRGVVSELPHGRDDESVLDVNLIAGGTHTSMHLDIIQPEGVRHPFARFAEEVTRKQFLGGIGHAIIHSKVVVIDPFSSDPTVITGSHNFSASASSKNDENFIIIKGDRGLAEAYAVNILGAFAHYRWRAFLAQTNRPFNGLKDHDRWQAPMLRAQRRDLKFWGV
jgi:phosphatidylserine/phosphatidylglycerophosphate/cardiolipin synthase-like enzyme